MFNITRVIKEPEVRRAELIDAALGLFRSGGYQKTMIIDITKKAGAAKGTFYHYFPSKEAILEAICNGWATKIATSFELESRQLTALPKLQLFIECLFLPNQLNILFKRLWDEEQLNLYYTAWKNLVEDVFNPLLADIIQQGNQEGTMRVTCPKETIAFFWSTLHCIWETLFFQEPPEVVDTKIKMAESLLERVLGIEEGALKISLTSYRIV
ncbi:MAG TPA: TetR/AcrR family transcriptional regulator [Methylomusa anaerophila]|uniref:Putative HTH-type transcriptional regulator YfiR n=1 Tax=Methylomusa anaerophila TaxID=1930071 RepID=A0A348AQJ9_9FIRM|nr:TetR/AcrR family transcriptional regulator [Methylomusa anaerophila]BBB93347.1 putative HTH-type transcriptional regulator YfiR [Methylomusa anaerophila]HML86823.1 TetR/AcrR family transcriptional regulator [Methylomusa anaerophila]